MKSWVKIILINAAVTLALLLSLNAVCEIAVVGWKSIYIAKSDPRADLPAIANRARARTFFSEYRQLETQYAPFVDWSYAPFSGTAINIDQHGRRRTVGPDKGLTVHLFGGSAMWGDGVWDAETIPSTLTRALPGIQAVNHGQSAYVSRQGLIALMSVLNSYDPIDAAVFYDGANDVQVLCQVAASVNGHDQEAQMFDTMRRRTQRDQGAFRDMFFSGMLQFTNIISDKLRSMSHASPSQTCVGNPKRAKQIADAWWSNWLAARSILSDRGIPFLAVLQPVAGFGHPNISYLQTIEVAPAEYEAVYPLIREKMGAHSGWTLDLSEVFDGDEPRFIDWAHVSPEANTIIAERIATKLRTLIAAQFGEQALPKNR